MPQPFSASLKSVIKKLLPVGAVELLQFLRTKPVPWDDAAIALHDYRREARTVPYPQYLYGLMAAARTARAVGCPRFTAIEFGVAGGNGLVAMERHADWVRKRTGVTVEVHGFDAGSGLPPPKHPYDCPFTFRGGEFAMDEDALRARLSGTLWLGDVNERIDDFLATSYAPIGFVSHDFDYYTSTRDAMRLFAVDAERLLPRITMYFDDLAGYPYTTATGEWAAIEEFNAGSADRRIANIWGLKFQLGAAFRFANWNESLFLLHVFDHARYDALEPQVEQLATGLRT